MKGTYSHTEGGFIQNSLRALVNAPVFTYYTQKQTNATAVWGKLKQAHDRNFLLTAGTDGINSKSNNQCGVTKAHAFSILDVFEIEDDSGASHKLYLMRNPWNNTKFSGEWNHADPKWTTKTLSQVPGKIDIRQSHKDGIFVVKDADLLRCFFDYQIGHIRHNEGYTDKWYDLENDDGSEKIYKFQPLKKRGDIYLSIESYFQQMIPKECTRGVNPLLKFTIYKNGAYFGYKWYYD